MRQGTVYLLHFDRPYVHARHYVGWTERDVSERVREHVTGHGSPLVAAAVGKGIRVHVARTWTGTRATERHIKDSHAVGRRYCPLCRTVH